MGRLHLSLLSLPLLVFVATGFLDAKDQKVLFAGALSVVLPFAPGVAIDKVSHGFDFGIDARTPRLVDLDDGLFEAKGFTAASTGGVFHHQFGAFGELTFDDFLGVRPSLVIGLTLELEGVGAAETFVLVEIVGSHHARI